MLVNDQLIPRDRPVKIQICWTLHILLYCLNGRESREKGNCSLTTTSARTGPKWRWTSSRNACIPSVFPSYSLYLTLKGSPFAPHPRVGHMSTTSCPQQLWRQHWGRPVVSVLADNGSLVSCCGALQWSAASLSTLHSTSFPSLPWTSHVRDIRRAPFLLSKWLLSFKGRANRLNQQMGLPGGGLQQFFIFPRESSYWISLVDFSQYLTLVGKVCGRCKTYTFNMLIIWSTRFPLSY